MSEEREEVIVGERRYRLDKIEYASRIEKRCDVCGEDTRCVYTNRREAILESSFPEVFMDACRL